MEEREPDDRDAERGYERRDDDLIGGVDDGLLQRLAHFHVAVDILDHHGRIVDQNADGKRQAAQRHDVDRLAGRVQADECCEDGKWDGSPHDGRGSP